MINRRKLQRLTLKERFFSAIEKTKSCWVWNGSKDRDGYGQIGFKSRLKIAHRLSYEMHVGKIPNGMSVLHRCDNPSCVNPKHLFLGDQSDNMRDMVRKGRAADVSGEKNPRAVLNKEDIRRIKTLGFRYRHIYIAKLFGISQSNVSAILRGLTWNKLGAVNV